MKPKKYYVDIDSIFIDKINQTIHIKDRMGNCCTKPQFIPDKVFNSSMDRLAFYLSNSMILCDHCFKGLTFDNFKKINNFNYEKYVDQSYKNKKNLNK